jgi:hypothetical protein
MPQVTGDTAGSASNEVRIDGAPATLDPPAVVEDMPIYADGQGNTATSASDTRGQVAGIPLSLKDAGPK